MPEVVVLQMAKEWNTPPWIIWEDCTQKWWDLRAAFEAEIALYKEHGNAEPQTIGELNPDG